jgi:hypothetical protein
MVDPWKNKKNWINKYGVYVIIAFVFFGLAIMTIGSGVFSKENDKDFSIASLFNAPDSDSERDMYLSSRNSMLTNQEVIKQDGIAFDLEVESIGYFNEISGEYEVPHDLSFPLNVVVKNHGNYDIPEDGLTVTMFGIPTHHFNDLGSLEQKNNVVLYGRTDVAHPSSEIVFSFTEDAGASLAENILWDGGRTTYRFLLKTSVDYSQGFVVKSACIIPNKDQYDKFCTTPGEKNVEILGGSLIVEGVREHVPSSNHLSYIIFVSQKDIEQEFGEFGKEIPLRNEFANIVPPEGWVCKTGGLATPNLIKFDGDGNARIECIADEPFEAGTHYTTDLKFELKYRQEETKTYEINFRKEN